MEIPRSIGDYLKDVGTTPRARPKLLFETDLGPSLTGRLIRYVAQYCPMFSLDYFGSENHDPAVQVLLGSLKAWFIKRQDCPKCVRGFFRTSPEALNLILAKGPSLSSWRRPKLPENPTFWTNSGAPAFLVSSGVEGSVEALLDTGVLGPEQSRILGFLGLIGLEYRILE